MNHKTKLSHRLAIFVAFTFGVGGIGWCQETEVEKAWSQGLQQLDAQDYAEAIKSFRKVVDGDPQHGQGWSMLGYALHVNGNLDEAIPVHEKACEFPEVKATALYNLGCAYSLKEENDRAIKFLHDAVSAGFIMMDYFRTDEDLANVRNHPSFAFVLERVQNQGMDPNFKSDHFFGDWDFVSGKRAGDDVEQGRLGVQASIARENIKIPSPNGEFVMKYKLNRKTFPVEIDIEIESGPAPEAKALGIMQMKDGELWFCYDPSGEKRPDSFESTAENGFFLFVLKKSAETGQQSGDFNN